MSCRTPVISSLLRIWIGWLISKNTPGMRCSALYIVSASSQYPRPVVQSSLSCSRISTSVISGLMMSMGTSAVPVLLTTSFTSGNCLMMRSTLALLAMLALRDAPFGRMLWKAKSPSSNCGMNSPPMRVKTNTADASSTMLRPITSFVWRNARSSSGR